MTNVICNKILINRYKQIPDDVVKMCSPPISTVYYELFTCTFVRGPREAGQHGLQ